MEPFLEQIGLMLKTERKRHKLNQTDVAIKVGMSRREIGEIEKGIFRGSVLKVQNYALSMGFSLTIEKKRQPVLSELAGLFDED